MAPEFGSTAPATGTSPSGMMKTTNRQSVLGMHSAANGYTHVERLPTIVEEEEEGSVSYPLHINDRYLGQYPLMYISRQSKLSSEQLSQLQKDTHFDKKELQQWYKGSFDI